MAALYFLRSAVKNLLLIPIFVFLLSACGSSEESDIKEDPYGINGSWKVQCYEDSPQSYFSGTLIFEAYQLIAISQYFADIDCSISISDKSSIGGSFKIENQVITGSGITASEIDFNFRILNGVDYGSEGAVDLYGLIKTEDNIMYISNGFSSQRPTDLNFNATYYKQ